MTPDQLRALDQRAGHALTAAARPLLPWLAALYIAGGTLVLALLMDGPHWLPVLTWVLGVVLASVVLLQARRRARVNAEQDGK